MSVARKEATFQLPELEATTSQELEGEQNVMNVFTQRCW